MRLSEKQEKIISSSWLQSLKNKYFWFGYCTELNKEVFKDILELS